MAAVIAQDAVCDISEGSSGKPSFITSPAFGGRVPVRRKKSVAPSAYISVAGVKLSSAPASYCSSGA